MWANFNFQRVYESPRAQVVLADSALSPPAELIMTASPA